MSTGAAGNERVVFNSSTRATILTCTRVLVNTESTLIKKNANDVRMGVWSAYLGPEGSGP